MLSKLSPRTLLIAIAVLALAVVISTYYQRQKPVGTLPKELLLIDTAAIDKLVLASPGNGAYTLLKDQGEWKLALETGALVPIEEKMLLNALSTLFGCKPLKVITRKQETHDGYEVTDEKGTSLTCYSGEKELGGVVIGKMDFNQQMRTMYNFVRVKGKDDVYLADAPLGFDWNKKASDWRNKTLLRTDGAGIVKVIATGRSPFSVLKQETGSWAVEGAELDSLSAQAYFDGLVSISSSDFVDQLTPSQLENPVMVWEVGTDKENVTLSLFEYEGEQVITSTQNPGAIFVFNETISQKLIPGAAAGVKE
ncbi:MAG: DUF4340 domain-containing protein [Bacteroidetes bacterium]|nr:DUF4340 domain-containing protein [Bacteroidota bacterium]